MSKDTAMQAEIRQFLRAANITIHTDEENRLIGVSTPALDEMSARDIGVLIEFNRSMKLKTGQGVRHWRTGDIVTQDTESRKRFRNDSGWTERKLDP